MEQTTGIAFPKPMNQRVKDLSFVVNVYKGYFGSITGSDQVTCKVLIDEYNAQLVAMAMIETAETGVTHNIIHVIQKKLEKWCQRGIVTVEDLEAARRKKLNDYYTAS